MVEVLYWSDAIYSIMAGLCLLLFSFYCFSVDKSIIAPATAFSLTWAITLLFSSITPLLGFYYLSNGALLLFVFGSIIFSTTSILVRNQFSRRKSLLIGSTKGIDKINFRALINFYNFLGLVAIPLLVLDILSHGSSINEIAYNIRRLTVEGESITSPLVTNYLVFGFFCSVLFIYALQKGRLNKVYVAVSLLPLFFGSLILGGRSGIVSLVIAWFFVVVFAHGRLKLRSIAWSAALLLVLLYLGAVWVNKIDVTGAGMWETILLFFEHIADYLFQGPVLFSQYFDGSIQVRENWDTLNSVCHALSKIDMCEPLPMHADFAAFGKGRFGNVYTFYFSLYPHYSYLGTVVFLIIYSAVITIFFEKARSGGIYSFVVSAFMFNAIVLTMFKDTIGYSFYQIVKFFIFYGIVIVFFSGKKYRLRFRSHVLVKGES